MYRVSLAFGRIFAQVTLNAKHQVFKTFAWCTLMYTHAKVQMLVVKFSVYFL